MAFLTVISATKGRKYGFVMVPGITLGLFVIGIAATLGLATLVSNSPWLYQMLRISGVLYLMWLAYQEWTDAAMALDRAGSEPQSLFSYFWRGFIVNVLNPKAGVFFVAILPNFIDPSESILSQAVFLTFVYVMVATLMHSLIVCLGGFLKPLLENEKRKRIVQRFLSVSLVTIAVWLVATT